MLKMQVVINLKGCLRTLLRQHPLLCLLQAGDESNQVDVKFELWRRVKGDVFERWEEQTSSLNPAKPPEPVSIETEDGTVIHGSRHRLQVHAALSW